MRGEQGYRAAVHNITMHTGWPPQKAYYTALYYCDYSVDLHGCTCTHRKTRQEFAAEVNL